MKAPAWTKHWRVDEVIECLEGTGAAARDLGFTDKPKWWIEHALQRAMPDAYADHPDDPDGENGRNEWPEADSHHSRKLARIWAKLPEDVRAVLALAYERSSMK